MDLRSLLGMATKVYSPLTTGAELMKRGLDKEAAVNRDRLIRQISSGSLWNIPGTEGIFHPMTKQKAEAKAGEFEKAMNVGATAMTITPSAEFVSKAHRLFGITENPKEGGWLGPDGKLLDFTGRNQSADYEMIGNQYVPKSGKTDRLARVRNLDHREASVLFGDWVISDPQHIYEMKQKDPNQWIDAMEGQGFLRLAPEMDGMATTVIPNDAQMDFIVSKYKYGDTPFFVEIYKPGGFIVHGEEIPPQRLSRASILRVFENAKKSPYAPPEGFERIPDMPKE